MATLKTAVLICVIVLCIPSFVFMILLTIDGCDWFERPTSQESAGIDPRLYAIRRRNQVAALRAEIATDAIRTRHEIELELRELGDRHV